MRLRLGDPGELIAALPHMLGFPPAESMVLICAHGSGRRRRLGAMARIDLPPPGTGAADLDDVVGSVVARLVPGRPDEVMLVVAGAGGFESPPHSGLVEAATAAFAAHEVPVSTRLWVPRVAAREVWRCYPPCDCRGAVGAIEDSPAAAATTWLGRVTFGSRTELEASLAPDAGADDPRMRELIDAELRAAVLDRELGGPAAARRDHAAVVAAREEVAAGRALGDTEVARLAVALSDPLVRDTVMGWAHDDDPQVVAGAQALWTALVRAVPAPEVAEPAILLTCALAADGGGALMSTALARALDADPTHRLSTLFGSLLASGAGPEQLREITVGASSESAARLGV